MRLFRLRFTVIGLLLCVFHAWCRTCGSDFDDPASSAYLAQVVLVGAVSQKLPNSNNTAYNVSVRIQRKGALKGEDILKAGAKRTPKLVYVSEFSATADVERCIGTVDSNSIYIFFLNRTSNSNFYKISAFPIPEKAIKKAKKDILKVTRCKAGRTCVRPPAVNPKRVMKDRSVRFHRTLELKCNLKGKPFPSVKFMWLKDGVEISKDKRISIRDRRRGSRLKIKKVTAPDRGKYECIAKNVKGFVKQTSVVTVTKEKPADHTVPQQVQNCTAKDRNWCFNGGICEIFVDLDRKRCKCKKGYEGTRCESLAIDLEKVRKLEIGEEDKLAQDRTLIIAGIVSGILLFIAICVASYFLAKRRRDRFYRRQRERRANNIEDNIPQVYRPLIGCDDVDGIKKPDYRGIIIHKQTQTTETCFLEAAKNGDVNLYINPLEGYIRPERKDKNSRSRLTAVSLEGVPQPATPTGRDIPDGEPSDGPTGNPEGQRPSAIPGANSGANPEESAPDGHPNIEKLFPKMARLVYKLGKDVPLPPALSLDTDSDEETPGEDTPLTPLHISEDEEDTARRGVNNQSDSFDKDYPGYMDEYHHPPPDYVSAMEEEEKLYASTSSSGYSDSSTPTSSDGDSQDGRYPYAHTFSNPPENRTHHWNERGSPEPHKANKKPFRQTPSEPTDQRPTKYAKDSAPIFDPGPRKRDDGCKRLPNCRPDQASIAL